MKLFLPMFTLFLISMTFDVTSQEEAFKAKRQSTLYYELDGATVVPPAPTRERFKLRLTAKYGLGYSCGKFDPVATISNAIDDIKDNLDKVEQVAITAGSAALLSAPMYILQRSNPDLAADLRNKKAEWQEKFDVAMKTCEQYESETAAGENPYGDWSALGKKFGFMEAAAVDGADVAKAKEKVGSEGGCANWVDGEKAGCKTGPPIAVVADVVSTGYQQMLGLKPSLDSGGEARANSASANETIGKKLGTVDEAKKFAVYVLGESEIVTEGDEKGSTSTPGHGLLALVEDETVSVSEGFDEVFENNSQDLSDWDKILSPSAGVSEELIEAYRNAEITDKGLIRNKLIAEIAFARIIDKALMLRRTLLSGIKEPNVYNSPANEQVRQNIDDLNTYIDELMFEKRIRSELMAGTVTNIMMHVKSKNGQPNVIAPPKNNTSLIKVRD